MIHNKKFLLKESLYLPDEGLQSAIEVAIELQMPLLVTGEPGTGKTQLAYYIAKKNKRELIRFNTKTTSIAQDILYAYDSLSHFRDIQKPESVKINIMDYIEFVALGKAIVEGNNKKQFVVLVDEIDKATRDFPNDILFEFENLAFTIKEAKPKEIIAWANQQEHPPYVDEQGFITNQPTKPNTGNPFPILVLTSNSEKNLPDAFTRRCIYYHISFPDRAKLKKIIIANVPLSENFKKNMLERAIEHFIEIRDQKDLVKKPATAELLAWLHILQKKEIDLSKDIPKQIVETYPVIAKNQKDLENLVQGI